MKHFCHALLRLLEKDHQACGIRKKKQREKEMIACLSSHRSIIH